MRRSILRARILRDTAPGGDPTGQTPAGGGGGQQPAGDQTGQQPTGQQPTGQQSTGQQPAQRPNVVPAGAQVAGQQTGQQSGTKPAEQTGQQQQPTGQQQEPGANLPNDPEALKAEIIRLRRESGQTRVRGKEQAAEEARNSVIQEIGKALGLVKTEEPPDPKVAATEARADAAETTLVAYQQAAELGVDASKLLNRYDFRSALSSLKPSDTADIKAKIEDAIKADPTLRTQAGAARSGGEFPGGAGETRRAGKALPMAEAVANTLKLQG